MSVASFFLWPGTMLGNSKESGNFLFFIASLMQFVRKPKEKSHSFKIFSGISPPAPLFEDKLFTISFRNPSEIGLKENLLVILWLHFVFSILGWNQKLSIILSILSWTWSVDPKAHSDKSRASVIDWKYELNTSATFLFFVIVHPFPLTVYRNCLWNAY